MKQRANACNASSINFQILRQRKRPGNGWARSSSNCAASNRALPSNWVPTSRILASRRSSFKGTLSRDFPPFSSSTKLEQMKLAEDTDPAAEQMLLQLLREATPARKMRMVLEANQTARTLALAGLKERHPGDSSARL